MTRSLNKALRQQKKQTQREVPIIPGSLGVSLGGAKVTEVPNRKPFVYVRLRDNPNEVVQAFNNKVSPSFNLPVVVSFQNGRYMVDGVDTLRYQSNWSSYAPFLPRHGNTHSADFESGGGGDITFVHPRQFIPSLVFPSGSVGAPNTYVYPYILHNSDGSWKYTGNTGTQDISIYRPTASGTARMVLVYLDSDSGNPYIIVNSGTSFASNLTGTSQIWPYIPTDNDPNHIPLAAVRLISGTTALGWDNIYDVRQFIHIMPTGTSGGVSTGTSMTIWDEGVPQGTATVLNFVGSVVDATVSGTVARVFVTGSTSGAPTFITGTNGVGQTFYFNSILAMETESGNAMRDMGTMNATDGASEFTQSFASGTTTFTSPVFITPQYWPGVQDIPRGMFRAYVTGRKDSGTRSLQAYVQIYKQATNGTQTLLTTTSTSPQFVTGSFSTYELYVEDGPFYLSVTDRLVAKVVVVGGSTGTDATLRLRIKSSSDERIEIPGGTPKIVRYEDQGWIPVPDDWLVLGNYSLLMSGNLVNIMRRGTKVRYVNTTGSYSYGVVGFATGTATTTVTLITNTDYIASGTLVNKYISYSENPEGFPNSFGFAANPQGFSAVPTSTNYKWSTKGEMMFYHYEEIGNGTSNATTFTASLPVQPITNGAFPLGTTIDNGTIQTTPGRCTISSTNTTLTFFKDSGNGAWTGGGVGKRAIVDIFYLF